MKPKILQCDTHKHYEEANQIKHIMTQCDHSPILVRTDQMAQRDYSSILEANKIKLKML